MTTNGNHHGRESPQNAKTLHTSHSTGWLSAACRIDSPNFDARPRDSAISLLVLHHISLPAGHFEGDAVIRLFTNQLDDSDPELSELAALRVSAHFFIRRDGSLIQFVNVFDRAWHAGVSSWRGRERCNDFSVGVEIEGDCEHPFARGQYETLNRLSADLASLLPIKDTATHAEIAFGRKVDPGPRFDLALLNAARNAQS
ncbi:MAG: 1,6-anhydro-N-acetylmuramyl-L-alanine amidase AmpD [Burkholderiales bacterium]|nr:MAG: 1,6-anhydro-N-acetylmuramyl-L-alanine amidase AmpD [Burkholderiales bacterium]